MQIDVNSAADRVQLIRTQLTSARSAPLNPKAPVSTDGRSFTDLASAPVKFTDMASAPVKVPLKFTDLASVPVTKFSDVRAKPSVTPTNPTPEGTTQPAPEPANRLEALLADWGKADSPYDLDGNGIVGVPDLLMLLAKMGGGSQQPQGPPGDIPADLTGHSVTVADQLRISDTSSPNPEPTDRLEALLADWGKADSPYDLDGNGIVGVPDLLMLLAKLGEPPAQPNAPNEPHIAPGKRVAIGVKAATIVQQAIHRLDQVDGGTLRPPEVDGSARTFDRLDSNHDDAPTRSELASQIRDILLDHLAKNPNANLHQFVQEAMKRLSDHDNADEAPNNRNPALERSSSVYRQANLTATARQLMQGLTDQGAMELRKFVQAGELSGNEKRTVLDQISSLRPGAQRVNLVG